MRRLARLRAARRARRAADTARAARRAGPADRRRGFERRVERGCPVRPDAARRPLRRAGARSVRRRAAHACRRLYQPSRPARRVSASRRGQRHAARQARRQAGGGDLGRHDSRERGLRGDPRTAGGEYRHGQRGLRRRESGGRCLSAWQCVVPHPARRSGPRAGGRCARAAAQYSVLAGRGARAQR